MRQRPVTETSSTHRARTANHPGVSGVRKRALPRPLSLTSIFYPETCAVQPVSTAPQPLVQINRGHFHRMTIVS
eukprot:scaffold3638_cov60-Phaeocystis_antarctica.AAC.1